MTVKNVNRPGNAISTAFAVFVQISALLSNGVQGQAERSLMSLISPRDIAQLTQLATDLAAQTMNSNAEILSKPGRPEVRPVTFDQSPSEMLGQSLTNLLQPASQQLASQLATQSTQNRARGTATFNAEDVDESVPRRPAGRRASEAASKPRMNAMNALLSLGGLRPPSNKDDTYGSVPLQSEDRVTRFQSQTTGDSSQMAAMNSIMDLANTFLGSGSGDGGASPRRSASSRGYYNEDDRDGSSGGGSGISRLLSMAAGGSDSKTGQYQMPTLRQFLPMADRNFGVDQGEGCLPFLGEFMKIAYGNCVKQADQRTWDTWGKEIQNALMGGKIDLLKASRETCKKGAEREQCGQVRRAVSECDIIGSIQLISNMQRSISRCDEISGIIDQNPTTVLSQMNGLINGEMTQGFLNNFLG